MPSRTGERPQRTLPLRTATTLGAAATALVPTLLLGAVLGSRLVEHRRSEIETQLMQTAVVIGQELTAFLDRHLQVAELTALSIPWGPDVGLDALRGRFAGIREGYPHLLALGFVTRDGAVRAMSPDTASDGSSYYDRSVNIADRAYFQAALRGRSTFSEPLAGRPTGWPVVVVAAPVEGRSQVPAVVVGSVDLRGFQDFWTRHQASVEGSMLVLDRANRVVFTSEGTGYDFLDPLVEAGAAVPIDPVDAVRDAMGPDRIGPTGRWSIDAVGWTVVVAQPEAVIGQALRPLYQALVALVAAAVVLATLLGGRLARSVTRPLAALEAVVSRLTDAPEAPVEPVDTAGAPAEIASLADGFVELSAGLRSAISALREREQAFRTVVDHAPEAILQIDAEEGRIFDANPAAELLFGRDREGLAGTPVAELSGVRDGGDGAIWPVMLLAAADGAEPFFEWTIGSPDRDPVPCEVRLTRLPGDRPVVRASILDVSERKRAEAERARLQSQLERAQRLEAVGQLTGGIAHDFNNLLTVVIGNLELLSNEPGAADDDAELLGGALAAAERGSALTHQLLAFSRRQSLSPRPVAIAEVVGEMRALLSRTVEEQIRIEEEHPATWMGMTDPAQLEHAVLNLAINARDSMPNGGTLTLSSADVTLDAARARSTGVEPGEYVALAVRDTGEGIPPEIVGQVFDPFFSTKETGRGSGLGLSMVYGFAQQSGGGVQLESELGVGTTVTLLLPRAVPARADTAAAGAG